MAGFIQVDNIGVSINIHGVNHGANDVGQSGPGSVINALNDANTGMLN